MESKLQISRFPCFSVPENQIPMLWGSLRELYYQWLLKLCSRHLGVNSGGSCHFTKEGRSIDGNVQVSCKPHDFQACALWKSCIHTRGFYHVVSTFGPFINQKTTLKKCSSPSSMRAILAQSFFSTENNCRTQFLQIEILFYKYQFA